MPFVTLLLLLLHVNLPYTLITTALSHEVRQGSRTMWLHAPARQLMPALPQREPLLPVSSLLLLALQQSLHVHRISAACLCTLGNLIQSHSSPLL